MEEDHPADVVPIQVNLTQREARGTSAGLGPMTGRKANLGPLTIDLGVAQARILSLRRMTKYTWEQKHIHSVMCRFHPLKSEKVFYQRLGTMNRRSRAT